jgi:hypothetical protein
MTASTQQRCITLPNGQRCLPTPFTYIFQVILPLASSTLLNQVLTLDSDGDFFLRAIYAIGANFNIRVQDANTYYLSGGPAPAGGLPGMLPIQIFQSEPTPTGFVFDHEIFFPAGSRILFDVQDTSGAINNTLKLLCRGIKNLYV